MKPRIYYSKQFFENYAIVFKYPKKMQTPKCRGQVELLHFDGQRIYHCCWVDSSIGEYNGKFVHYEDAPQKIKDRVDYLAPIWEKACKTNEWLEWNEA